MLRLFSVCTGARRLEAKDKALRAAIAARYDAAADDVGGRGDCSALRAFLLDTKSIARYADVCNMERKRDERGTHLGRNDDVGRALCPTKARLYRISPLTDGRIAWLSCVPAPDSAFAAVSHREAMHAKNQKFQKIRPFKKKKGQGSSSNQAFDHGIFQYGVDQQRSYILNPGR